MSFGVGIGDILLVTKIGFTLWVNISGAKKEREDLTAKLMEWKDKLEIVEPMLANVELSPRAAKHAREQLTEALATLQVLEELNRKLVKGKVLRQAAWEVTGRAKFQQYQMDLEKKLEMLDMLFLSGSMKMVTDGVRETNVVLKRVENRMKYVGFSPDHEPIRFVDALGYERPLPFDLCLNYENIVSMCFKESPGKSFVERGDYDITNEESGALLGPEDWTVTAGMMLSMAIVIRKNVRKGESDHRCPGCGTKYTGHVGTGYQRVNCTYCKRWFQITSKITVVDTPPNDPEQKESLSSGTGEPSKNNDLMHIQRFHIRVNEVDSRR
ncbi:hypothetical protein DFP73DRAFT_239062 [Morchella snyderi]|nr:hypothetical protein DFP73DRAFT_239062 [Morchella snyderi]